MLAAVAAPAPPPPPDSVYADSATRQLVALARARHAAQDTLVADYEALLNTTARVALGRSRFGRAIPFWAGERVTRIEWSQPNDLKMEIIGRRQRAISSDVEGDAEPSLDGPWFFPRGLGDSIRLGGDFPERAALHPLAAGGDAFYRYALVDSIVVAMEGRRVRLAAIEVQPQRMAASLVAGRLWLDRETGEVTRFTFFFLGDFIFDTEDLDSLSTRKDTLKVVKTNRMIARAVRIDADLEYALYEQRYWMPYRQLVTAHIEDIWITGVTLPLRFETTFSEYKINRGQRVAFTLELPDSLERRDIRDSTGGRRWAAGRWGGGRWEIQRHPVDSLEAYKGWADSLELSNNPEDEQRFKEVTAELASLAEALPPEWVGGTGVTVVKAGEFFRFNRATGVSLGTAYAWQPGMPFLRLIGSVRYGFEDGRVYWGLTARRDAPRGLFELDVSRRLAEPDPRSTGGSLGNSLNALFLTHDDADYYLALGVRATATRPIGKLSQLQIGLGFEEQQSVSNQASSAINDWFGGDGILQPNPPIQDGTYATGMVRLDRPGTATRWKVGADGLLGEGLFATRIWGDAEQRLRFLRVRLAAGYADRAAPPQLQFRAGGPRTVRGHQFGVQVGRAMWSAQAELTLPRKGLEPFVFGDVGAAGDPETVFSMEPLIGVGGGLSLNLVLAELRLEVAKSIGHTRVEDVRVDLLLRVNR